MKHEEQFVLTAGYLQHQSTQTCVWVCCTNDEKKFLCVYRSPYVQCLCPYMIAHRPEEDSLNLRLSLLVASVRNAFSDLQLQSHSLNWIHSLWTRIYIPYPKTEGKRTGGGGVYKWAFSVGAAAHVHVHVCSTSRLSVSPFDVCVTAWAIRHKHICLHTFPCTFCYYTKEQLYFPTRHVRPEMPVCLRSDSFWHHRACQSIQDQTRSDSSASASLC